MLDAGDKKWIEETFTTKKDLEAFATKGNLNELKSEVATLAADMSHVRGKMDEMAGHAARMEVLANRMADSADKLGGRLNTLEQENKVGVETMRRHTVQIETLA